MWVWDSASHLLMVRVQKLHMNRSVLDRHQFGLGILRTLFRFSDLGHKIRPEGAGGLSRYTWSPMCRWAENFISNRTAFLASRLSWICSEPLRALGGWFSALRRLTLPDSQEGPSFDCLGAQAELLPSACDNSSRVHGMRHGCEQ